MKNLIKTMSLLTFAVIFACGNNTSNPDTTTETAAPATSVQGLTFTGTSDSAVVSISFADNYLEKILKGNTYPVNPGILSLSATKVIKAQVSITNFSYFQHSVDITCDKDDPANGLDLVFTGSNSLGQDIVLNFNTNDGLYYTSHNFYPSYGYIGVQGPEDEIEKAYISDASGNIPPHIPAAALPQTFFCKGSDGNDYNVMFHSNYDGNNLAISSIFDMQDKTFTGAIEVQKRNFIDAPVVMYFSK